MRWSHHRSRPARGQSRPRAAGSRAQAPGSREHSPAGSASTGQRAVASTRIWPTPMAGYGSAFGRGLILGAAGALLYAVARETLAPARPTKSDEPAEQPADEAPRLVDWDWATKMAIRTAGRTPTLHPGARAQ